MWVPSWVLARIQREQGDHLGSPSGFPSSKGGSSLSEYQYYEFQAIDRPLGEADRRELRRLSTRARISATSFVNHYNWGDFKGKPRKLMERWFDLHLYVANWGTRRLMIRLPRRFLDRSRIRVFLREVDWVVTPVAGRHRIIDIHYRGEAPGYYEPDDDGPGLLEDLAPLRADLLSGDLRLFYLLRLTAVEAGYLERDEEEPLPGIGPLSGALEAFADFFSIDPDLVQAAAEAPLVGDVTKDSGEARRRAVEAIPEAEKTALLGRVADGDPHVMYEVQRRIRRAVRDAGAEMKAARRTVADLQGRAEAIREERRAAEAKRLEAERRRKEQEAERKRRRRIDLLRRRGESVWDEVETQIGKRNASGYDRAAGLIFDLRTLAEEEGEMEEFSKRVRSIRHRHARKRQFLLRLAALP